jgi:redox-sensitive bicupin YhaK (pirin superfamily)
MKTIVGITKAPSPHWVGDGFPVRTLFSYNAIGRDASPFLLLDHAGPTHFEPAPRPRGVGEHPHRGFETVTIVYDGEVAHRDSTGQGGVIGPGDVQWMTAGSGILHEEFHSPEFTARGGPLEMAQLWVNLPARSKMTAPGYQAITASQIPTVDLPRGAGTVRVIAGELADAKGPARTFTPINVRDLRLNAGSRVVLQANEGWALLLPVLRGSVRIADAAAQSGQVVVMSRSGGAVTVEAVEDSRLLWLEGEPIDEPLVGYGPFVMNSREEIIAAIEDFNGGRFGRMPGAN